jgi:WD40 repeat protein
VHRLLYVPMSIDFAADTLSMSRDGNTIAGANAYGFTRVWDVQNRKQVAAIPGPATKPTGSGIALSQSGKQIVISPVDGPLVVHDVPPTKPKLQKPDAQAIVVLFDENSNQLIALSKRQLVKTNLETEEETVWVFPLPVGDVRITPSGKRVVAIGKVQHADSRDESDEATLNPYADTWLRVWEVGSGAELLQKNLGEIKSASIDISDDGERVASVIEKSGPYGSRQNVVSVDEVGSHRTLWSRDFSDLQPVQAEFNADGNLLLVMFKYRTPQIWRANDAQLVYRPILKTGTLAAWNPSATRLVVASTESISVWDIAKITRRAN